MNRVLFGFLLSTALVFVTSTATAFTVSAFAHTDKQQAIWVPELGHEHLIFDEGATLTINPDSWKLEGTLTSADGSNWSMAIDFSDLYLGPQFSALTSMATSQVPDGIEPSTPTDRWGLAGTIRGQLTALDGEQGGRTFSLARNLNHGDLLTDFENCPNEVECNKDLSIWTDITDKPTGTNIIGVSNPVPEPSAALVFGLGTVLASSSIRRRNDR